VESGNYLEVGDIRVQAVRASLKGVFDGNQLWIASHWGWGTKASTER
jgi:hypothetical protein